MRRLKLPPGPAVVVPLNWPVPDPDAPGRHEHARVGDRLAFDHEVRADDRRSDPAG